MFLHEMKYYILSMLRNKVLVFWLIAFPIGLGTLFHLAFSGLYDKTTKFSTIPVAVVENSADPVFDTIIDSMCSGDDPMLRSQKVAEDKALKMLESGDIKGIIYNCGTYRTLTVYGSGMDQTILKEFLDQYAAEEKMIKNAVMHDPNSAEKVISIFADEASSCREIPVTHGNTDNFIQYFYNLLAMTALYNALVGLRIAENNSPNMSVLGARKGAAPAKGITNILGSFAGSFILSTLCTCIAVSFIHFILGVDFGKRLPLVYLSAIVGGMLGISMGFMVGVLGKGGLRLKNGIVMSVCMMSCFISGLMLGEMKAFIAKFAPWFNSINPASLISDSFYCLNIYGDYRRFITKMASMLIMSAVFTLIGFIMSRRKSYASI